MKFIVFFFFLHYALSVVHVKHLAGPPEEFQNHVIPDPRDTATVESSHSEKIVFQLLGNNVIYEQDIPVDGPNQFAFMFASPHDNMLKLRLTDPTGNEVDLDSVKSISAFPIGDESSVPVSTYSLLNTVRGVYHLSIEKIPEVSDEIIRELSDKGEPCAIITVLNNDYIQIQTHLSSYLIRTGNTFGLVSRVIDTTPNGNPVSVSVSSAMMMVVTPNGQDIDIPMNDDGINGDALSNDGWYTALLPTALSGEYLAEANVVGYYVGPGLTDSVAFRRTTQHVVSVSSSTAYLGKTASLRNLDNDRYAIDISVTSSGKEPTLRAYAEVWGIDVSTKSIRPVCWIGGIVEITNSTSNGQFISLELNKNWLTRSGTSGPLSLRNVYISDLSTSFPIDKIDGVVNVQNSDNLHEISVRIRLNSRNSKLSSIITNEMLYGVNPLETEIRNKSSAASANLVLLPGYCSNNNPFMRSKEEFPTGVFFIGQRENLKNDDYAKKVMAWIDTQDVGSFGLIAHSQGGMVSLHMHNYYFTGLESASGGRLIQTVGSPYQGTSAAGSAADLGNLFGYGCGSQSDLSRDGAVNWLSGISGAARKDVYYFTTTYKTKTTFGDYCSLAMNLVLKSPNDGTTELIYATLDGGNSMGNTEQWCHSQNMGYPPQSDDETRNKDMYANAAH